MTAGFYCAHANDIHFDSILLLIKSFGGIPPQIIVIYTTMSPILFIFGPKVAPQVLVTNPKNF